MITETHVNKLLENYTVLTEEQLVFLTENRVQFIKAAVKDKLDASHDAGAAKMDSDKIVDHIASKIDPTPNKEYTQWLVNRYKNKEFSVGDHKEIKKAVSTFHEARPYTPVTDIGAVKSIAEMNDHSTIAKGLMATKKVADEEVTQPLEEVFRSGNVYGVKLPNARVSTKLYGPNGKVAQTRWCTASEGANAFKQYPGGKYVLHLPNGDVAQANHQKSQFMDKHDRAVDLKQSPFNEHADAVRGFISHTAKLEGGAHTRLVEEYNAHASKPVVEGTLKELIDKNNHHASSYNRDDYNVPWATRNEHINGVNDTHKAATELAMTRKLSDADFHAALTKPIYEDRYNKNELNLRTNLSDNPNLTLSQVHALADTEYVPHPDVEHDKESIHKAINNIGSDLFSPYNSTAKKYLGHEALHPDHVAQLYRRANNVSDKAHALSHLHSNVEIPSHVVEDALSNPTTAIKLGRTRAVSDPTVAQKVFDAVTNEDAQGLVNNKHLAVPVLMNNLDKAKHLNYQNFLDRDDVTPDHAGTLVNHYSSTMKQNGSFSELMGHPKVSRALFEAKLKSNPASFAGNSSVLNSRRIKSSDIDFLLDNGHVTPTTVYGSLRSRALKPTHIDKLIDQGHSKTIADHLIDENPTLTQVTHSHIHRLINDTKNTSFHQRVQLIAHPKVSLPVFQQALQDRRLHGAIASSPYAPPSILHSLATTGMDHVRRLVAGHKNTSQDTLRVLAADESKDVSSAAMKRVKK